MLGKGQSNPLDIVTPGVFQESIITSELERRLYLYLIGGEYEQQFYSYVGSSNSHLAPGQEELELVRVKLDIEIAKGEQSKQTSATSADYVNMLDYLLTRRVKQRLVNKQRLLESTPEISAILPLLEQVGHREDFSPEMLEQVEQQGWLVKRLRRFIENSKLDQRFNISPTSPLSTQLQQMGYPLFTWSLGKLTLDELSASLHPSLRPMLDKLRQFASTLAGALVVLSRVKQYHNLPAWRLYLLAALNVLPMTLILNSVSHEINAMVKQQKRQIRGNQDEQQRLDALDNYRFPEAKLRELLQLDEKIKPRLLGALQFGSYQPLRVLQKLGKANSSELELFAQARAYTLYRLLNKAGRIKPHEALTLLNGVELGREALNKLSSLDLLCFNQHLNLYQQSQGNY